MDEVFRFTVLRPPQRYSHARGAAPMVLAYLGEPSQFANKLMSASPADAAAAAQEFIGGKTYLATLTGLDLDFATLDRMLLPPTELSDEKIAAAVQFWFHAPAANIVKEPKYRAIRERLADSLFAASLSRAARAPGQENLVRGLQLCGAIETLANPQATAPASAALRARVVLPRAARPDAAAKANPAQQDRAAQLATINALKSATEELKRVARRKQLQVAAKGPPAKQGAAKPASADRLQKGEAAALSAATKQVLTGFKITADGLYLPGVIRHLENYVNMDLSVLLVDFPWVFLFGPSVPGSVGRARIAGISDLLVVRQNVKRYQLGEIAHIENVMRGESYGRVFRRKDASEVVEEEETERTESLERDLQTTSKFELKTEAERTIREDLQFEAGVNFTASGPGIEVGANAGFSYSRATEDANKLATTFARDVVDRSVSKLQERELKRRTSRTTREIEETADHKMNNAAGAAHVVGVYRWVDKIYEAQVVNYGRRLILEFVLIEPAAFLRSARTQRPLPGVMGQLPEPPQFLDPATGRKRPLAVTDLTRENFLTWVTQYAVTGAAPPPADEIIIGTSLEQTAKTPATDSASAVLTTGALKVTPGYLAQETWVEWAGEKDTAQAYWEILVGTQEFLYDDAGGATRPLLRRDITDGFNYDNEIPVSMVVKNFGSFTANIAVRCTLTAARLTEWQIATFNSIMTRYSRLKAEYDDQVAAAQVQSAVPLGSGNPLNNREIERNELRRQSIAMITGQNFDLFNAMGDSGSMLAYPQVNDFAEARAEGNYVQFFEQALEWRHMTYLFYPYFWGRKATWVDAINQSEDDPLFAQFLRAGAARVQVPVRPGFEPAIDFFLKNGKVWLGGEPPTFEEGVSDDAPPFVPLFQELQEQTGLEVFDGPGTVAVTSGSHTVQGAGTAFAGLTGADFEINANREIRIGGRDYRIRAVISPTELSLTAPYAGATQDALPYGLGPKLIGQPWDIRLPTQMVMLQGAEAELNPVV